MVADESQRCCPKASMLGRTSISRLSHAWTSTFSASTHDQPDVIASEPICLGPDNTIVRRNRQIVPFSTRPNDILRTKEYMRVKRIGAVRLLRNPLCMATCQTGEQPVEQSDQALAIAVVLQVVYGLSVASKAT